MKGNLNFKMKLDRLKVFYGSTAGRYHKDIGRNNQDSVSAVASNKCIVGVVADGCSACEHSEVGSYLTATFITQRIASIAEAGYSLSEESSIASMLEDIRLDTIGFLRTTALHLSSIPVEEIVSSLLTTIVGVIITEKMTYGFSIGDGYLIVNDTFWLKADPNDSYPAMIAYGAIPSHYIKEGKRVPFSILGSIETDAVESIVIATDGLQYLIKAEGNNIPGTTETIMPVSQLPTSEVCGNSVLLTRYLKRIGNTSYKPLYNKEFDLATQTVERSPLYDDTTILVIRPLTENELAN
jgi:hypothetical protein